MFSLLIFPFAGSGEPQAIYPGKSECLLRYFLGHHSLTFSSDFVQTIGLKIATSGMVNFHYQQLLFHQESSACLTCCAHSPPTL